MEIKKYNPESPFMGRCYVARPAYGGFRLHANDSNGDRRVGIETRSTLSIISNMQLIINMQNGKNGK
jgi:hypothetical protein